MRKQKRDFLGIWIPREIWLSFKLTIMEKLLFVEIRSLDNERGCFASNAYFAEFFGLSSRQIANHISSLRRKGYIVATIREHHKRVIRARGRYAFAVDPTPNAAEATFDDGRMPLRHYERRFEGIWIPREIWLSKELSVMEKVLFVEIQSLDNERGCFASNAYFSEFFGLSTRQISTHVSSLKNKGFVDVEIHENSNRIIRVKGKYARIPDSELRRFKAELRDLARRKTIRSYQHPLKHAA